MGVQRVVLDGQRTWTVTGEDHLPVGPVEEYLEFLRVAQQSSPNTIRSYATSLARWWEYLTAAGGAWDEVSLPFFVSFVASLRTVVPAGVTRLPAGEQPGAPADSTVAARVTAVLSFYRYHADVHQVPVAGRLYRMSSHGGRYVPGLVHLQRGRVRPGPAVRVRRPAGAAADSRAGGGHRGRVRAVGSGVRAVVGIGPRPVAVRRARGDRDEARGGAVDPALRLACRARPDAVRRGHPAAGPSGRGPVQERPVPADLYQRRAGAPAQRVRLAAV